MNSSLQLTPQPARILSRQQETTSIFSLELEFVDQQLQESYFALPGQFNMVYLFGGGEIPISVIASKNSPGRFQHTIRSVGRISHALADLQVGDMIGIRGPFGNSWPIDVARGKDIVVIAGGLGCAAVVSVIHYLMEYREQFGAIKILQGIKHSDDLIFKKYYQTWAKAKDTEVFISADTPGKNWSWYSGHVTDFIKKLILDAPNTIAMMCGPEVMMHVATESLIKKNISEESIYLSLERNMQCAIGHCGHCQYGPFFVCKDGPVFNFKQIKKLFYVKGF